MNRDEYEATTLAKGFGLEIKLDLQTSGIIMGRPGAQRSECFWFPDYARARLFLLGEHLDPTNSNTEGFWQCTR